MLFIVNKEFLSNRTYSTGTKQTLKITVYTDIDISKKTISIISA